MMLKFKFQRPVNRVIDSSVDTHGYNNTCRLIILRNKADSKFYFTKNNSGIIRRFNICFQNP